MSEGFEGKNKLLKLQKFLNCRKFLNVLKGVLFFLLCFFFVQNNILSNAQAKSTQIDKLNSDIRNILDGYQITLLDSFVDDNGMVEITININTNAKNIKAIGRQTMQKILSSKLQNNISAVDIALINNHLNQVEGAIYNGEICSFMSEKKDFECKGKKNIPSYKIEEQSCFEPYKCSYDVRIKSKLSEDELLTIAYEIFDTVPAVNKVFITFLLPCMKIGHGAWASAIFDPTAKVNIMDFSLTNNPACLDVK